MSTGKRKLALITGGTSGIGFGAAKKLAPECDLALGFASDEAKAEAALKELQACAPEATIRTYKRAIRNFGDCQELVGQVTKDFDRATDILVNSGGRIDDALFLDIPYERHAAIVEEHLLGTMGLCHLVLKDMYRARWGRIVCLSSISARYAKRGQSNYAAAKSGIEGFVKTLALEVAHRGVTINAIAPGLIATPMTQNIMDKFAADPKELRRKVPAGYAGTPEDAGELVSFLASDKARYITGQVITIDGGRSLGDFSS
jgi:3-oxoacyl-[acyl-carrier protein] reductase